MQICLVYPGVGPNKAGLFIVNPQYPDARCACGGVPWAHGLQIRKIGSIASCQPLGRTELNQSVPRASPLLPRWSYNL